MQSKRLARVLCVQLSYDISVFVQKTVLDRQDVLYR